MLTIEKEANLPQPNGNPMIPSAIMTTETHDTLKSLIPFASPAIKATIDNWLAPAVAKIAKAKELIKNSRPEEVEKAFEEYLFRSYGKLSFMNTIVFGNQQKRIQDLYIPLTIISTGTNKTQFVVDQWHEEFLPAFKRAVITDTAGMGKSTILKWLFICSLGTSKGIPIFVELRTLTSQKGILDKIYEDLCPINKPFDKDLLLHLIKEGKFIFFLDGFDEVGFEDRRSVTEDIQNFIVKAFNNLFLLASRHETALASFGDFREFAIKPLIKNEAYSLLRRYDESQEHAEALIAELEESKYDQLKDLMVNPMLVSLLFKAYSYKPKVPFKKQIFYRQVFDALFDMHDSTKGGAFVRKKSSNLDIDEFHLVMRDLGFTTAKLGKIEYEKDSICEIIKSIRERNGSILFQPASLLTDLVTTVPLFNKEGDHFKWAHKSVQDYFASQFIAIDAKGNECQLLQHIYERGHCRRFENILDMLHDTDNRSFRHALLARLLKDYIQHYESQYQMPLEGISIESIEQRKQLSFGGTTAIATVTTQDMHTVFGNKGPEQLFRSLKTKKFKPDTFVAFHADERILIVGFHPDPAFGLLPLLAARKYPYVSKAKLKYQKSFKGLADLGPICVTDDPKSPLNTPEHFDAVNQLLSHHGFHILIEPVRRTLQNIDGEECENKHVSQLLENL